MTHVHTRHAVLVADTRPILNSRTGEVSLPIVLPCTQPYGQPEQMKLVMTAHDADGLMWALGGLLRHVRSSLRS